jgi:hypothetical protein
VQKIIFGALILVAVEVIVLKYLQPPAVVSYRIPANAYTVRLLRTHSHVDHIHNNATPGPIIIHKRERGQI